MHILLKELLESIKWWDNPNFKSWFKNSIVVDNNGKPLRVYHGTSKDTNFSKFKEKQNGIWFTSSPEAASTYADQNDSMKTSYEMGPSGEMIFKDINTASRVLPLYLSIQNPAKLSDEQMNKLKFSSNYTKAQREVFGDIMRAGYDGIDFGDGIYVVFKATQIKSALSNNGDFDPNNPDINK